jgi:hypothetical protein
MGSVKLSTQSVDYFSWRQTSVILAASQVPTTRLSFRGDIDDSVPNDKLDQTSFVDQVQLVVQVCHRDVFILFDSSFVCW